MSLRVRLGLCYGIMAGFAILLVNIVTYAVHTRAHYDDLDQRLHAAAEHALVEGTSALRSSSAPAPSLIDELDIAVRLIDGTATLRAQSPGADRAPLIDPREVLGQPSGPPYDWLAQFGPPILADNPGRGAFGLMRSADGTRWRLYALPAEQSTGYALTAGSLERIDASVTRLRQLMILVSVVGLGVTLACATLLAGRVLHPIAVIARTADHIARSGSFTDRVPLAPSRDELSRLAATFNVMLSRLEQAFAAQQRFVSDASHELRAPLTAIQANLDLVEQRLEMPEADRREAIDEAAREARRLAQLVADLLTLARADARVPIRRQPVELDRVVMDAFAEARHFARGQSLRVDRLVPGMVIGDADRLKQALIALLDNAIKYTPPDGMISVALDRLDGSAQITIRDNGSGIAADDLPHVFERFYRADPGRARDPSGTGLGLPIARWIVQQHGGQLTLSSAPGEGTTATLHLPLAPA